MAGEAVAQERWTPKQRAVLDSVELGMTLSQGAKRAGYARHRTMALELKKNTEFMAEADRRAKRNQAKMQMTREKVQAMVLEAYEVAKLTDDANAMVRAASEINKMCGFYEVEKAQIELSNAQRDFLGRLDDLSDEELIAMSGAAEKINPGLELEIEEAEYEDFIDGVANDDS